MNKRQKEVIASQLDDEKAVLQALEKNYTTALADIKRNIKELQANPLTQSKAYQLEFQKQLEKQLSGIVDNLHGKNFASIADYLNTCYNSGFMGTMYDLQGQGVPLVLPIDQEQVLKAVQKTGDDIKLANKLGVSTKELKKQVLAELQRGLATQLSYSDIARNISSRGSADMNRSMRIARTEGHRVQNEAKMDSLNGAKKKGADVVKQWDSTLDSSTRDTHVELDGQIRELDENFTCSGGSAPYPGGFGNPAEDCNCRCCMLQRARWAVKDETSYQKWNNETGGFIECSGYADFKDKYLKAAATLTTGDESDILKLPIESDEEHYKKLIDGLSKEKVDYNPVLVHSPPLSEQTIIQELSGGDRTQGSCASLGLTYIGQKQGWNVLDFRDGESRKFFANYPHLVELFNMPGIKTLRANGGSYVTVGNHLLKQCEVGKEYYLCVGRHAAIVRKQESGVLQYLELQSATNSGWQDFAKSARETLSNRFGCSSASSPGASYWSFMVDIDDSNFNTNEFKSILGYINTSKDMQVKGVSGFAK